ncbi:MAG TPA: MBL fold metallo-hydrolase [Pseudogracilibacillus sp.]|nr:MBL fold metallo-hydrolase [Pseudogracilibacillus sp.]
MKLTVIGYWGGFPAAEGASSAYMIEKEGFTLLLDMGSGALMTLQKYKKASELDAVILSHYHADHIADIGVLQHALFVESFIHDSVKTVPIYGHTVDRNAFRQLNDKKTEAMIYTDNETLKLGPFFIRFLQTNHPVPCFGMRITDGTHTIVYTGDSGYQNSWIPFSKDADLLLADCNFYASQISSDAGHMTSHEVAQIATEAQVKELILTHLPHYGDHTQLVNEAATLYSGKIQLAQEGLVWGS